jgi:hypothetical protein
MNRKKFEAEFAAFLNSRARPVLEETLARRRGLIWRTLAVGLAVSVLAGLVIHWQIYQLLALAAGQSLSPFLFVILSGCFFGVIAGVIAYIIFLKRLLDNLRLFLIGSLGEFVDPAFKREAAPAADGIRLAEFFPEELAGASLGKDVFRGAREGWEISLAEILPAARAKNAGEEKEKGLGGVFLQAGPASGSGADDARAWPEGMSAGQSLDGRRLLLRRKGRVLALALVGSSAPGQIQGRLSGLGLEGYLEFAWEARLCLEVLSACQAP